MARRRTVQRNDSRKLTRRKAVAQPAKARAKKAAGTGRRKVAAKAVTHRAGRKTPVKNVDKHRAPPRPQPKTPRKPPPRAKTTAPGPKVDRRRGMRPERRRVEEVRRLRTVVTEPVPGTSNHPKVQVLARLMRERREGLQLSANGAAQLSGLARRTVGNFEQGEVSALLDSFFWLCDGYGISTVEMMVDVERRSGPGRRVG